MCGATVAFQRHSDVFFEEKVCSMGGAMPHTYICIQVTAGAEKTEMEPFQTKVPAETEVVSAKRSVSEASISRAMEILKRKKAAATSDGGASAAPAKLVAP